MEQITGYARPGMRVLAAFAHPDDESFGPGGTLALLAHGGAEITLLTFTRGERSTLGLSSRFSSASLAERRADELAEARVRLGIGRSRLLDYPDQGLSAVAPGELAGHVRMELERVRPHLVITFDTTGITGHPDHIAVSLAVLAAVDTYSRQPAPTRPPIQVLLWTVPQSVAARMGEQAAGALVARPDVEVSAVVEVGTALDTQCRAIAAHRSQSTPWPELLVARLAGQGQREYFVLAAATPGFERPLPPFAPLAPASPTERSRIPSGGNGDLQPVRV